MIDTFIIGHSERGIRVNQLIHDVTVAIRLEERAFLVVENNYESSKKTKRPRDLLDEVRKDIMTCSFVFVLYEPKSFRTLYLSIGSNTERVSCGG